VGLGSCQFWDLGLAKTAWYQDLESQDCNLYLWQCQTSVFSYAVVISSGKSSSQTGPARTMLDKCFLASPAMMVKWMLMSCRPYSTPFLWKVICRRFLWGSYRSWKIRNCQGICVVREMSGENIIFKSQGKWSWIMQTADNCDFFCRQICRFHWTSKS